LRIALGQDQSSYVDPSVRFCANVGDSDASISARLRWDGERRFHLMLPEFPSCAPMFNPMVVPMTDAPERIL